MDTLDILLLRTYLLIPTYCPYWFFFFFFFFLFLWLSQQFIAVCDASFTWTYITYMVNPQQQKFWIVCAKTIRRYNNSLLTLCLSSCITQFYLPWLIHTLYNPSPPPVQIGRPTPLVLHSNLPVIKLETISGRISILRSLMRISPGNPMAIMALSDGSANRSTSPNTIPIITDATVKTNNKFILSHCLNLSLNVSCSCGWKVYSCFPDSTSILLNLLKQLKADTNNSC